MKKTFQELLSYLKNPILEKDTNQDAKYRFKKFGYLLIICLLTGFLISPIFVIIEEFGLINMEDHAMEEMMKNFPKVAIFVLAVVVAPSFEELIFRGPLTLFKGRKSFKIAFYTLTILFGLVHISNFTITKNVLLLTPILVLPQILLGGYLGFIRVRFGLGWSIALHACYNGILMLITLSTDLH
ncbi:MAG: CPBP family intramembrane glutamic endopeptidase [Polaribacter sp.]